MRVWNPRLELGGLTEADVKEATFLLWKGHCSVHQRFRPEHVAAFRAEHPDGIVIAHPECAHDVCELADQVGSTDYIIKAVEAAPPGSVIARRHRDPPGQPAERRDAGQDDRVARPAGLPVLDDVPHRRGPPGLGAREPRRGHASSTRSPSMPTPPSGPRSRSSGCSRSPERDPSSHRSSSCPRSDRRTTGEALTRTRVRGPQGRPRRCRCRSARPRGRRHRRRRLRRAGVTRRRLGDLDLLLPLPRAHLRRPEPARRVRLGCSRSVGPSPRSCPTSPTRSSTPTPPTARPSGCSPSTTSRRPPSRATPSRSYDEALPFAYRNATFVFKSSRPHYVRHAFKQLGRVVNRSTWTKELYEEKWSWIFPAYEVRYELERDRRLPFSAPRPARGRGSP